MSSQPLDECLRALVDKDEIHGVIMRFARGIDRLDQALIAGCYHPDGYDDHNIFRGLGSEFARWSAEEVTYLQATKHFIGHPEIELMGDAAVCNTYCIAHHISLPGQRVYPPGPIDPGEPPQSDLVLGMRYFDRFERRNGPWLIAARICVYDWSYSIAFDPARGLAMPSDWHTGQRSTADVGYRIVDDLRNGRIPSAAG